MRLTIYNRNHGTAGDALIEEGKSMVIFLVAQYPLTHLFYQEHSSYFVKLV